MTTGVPVQVCSRCGRHYFPHRLVCGACGSREFATEPVAEGVVEEITVVRRIPGRVLDEPVILATVLLGSSPRIVARVTRATEPGAVVGLRLENGAPVSSER